MAEPLHVVLKNLSSVIEEAAGLTLGVNKKMKKLASILTTIQGVLEDSEQKQLESNPIRNWLIKLEVLTYEIDDILDICATHVYKLKHKNSIPDRNSLKKILFRHKIGRRMKQVTEKLDAVAAERANFNLRDVELERPRMVAATARETGALLSETDPVYGRVDEKEEIVDMLVNRVRDNQEVSILPLTGLGGIGKTTLAGWVFKDPRVDEHFETKLWVYVSENFDVKALVMTMIESASGSASNLGHLDALERRLWYLLKQKRFLVVLDDVWNHNEEIWSKLRNVLPCGSNGSSIIVTTRQGKVAEIMGTLPTKNLKGLLEEHCWMSLKQRAFGQEEEEEHPKLKAIGKQIVKKCAGVPLAAKAIGALVRFERREKEWIHIKEGKIWDLPQEENPILPALRLSYNHLPSALKPYFAYYAIFPKNHEIGKEELIRLWMAHGYISSNEALEVEDVGDRIWNEFVVRSFFQDVLHYETRTTFMMHNLVLDLALSIMKNKAPDIQLSRFSTIASNHKIHQVNLSMHHVAFLASFQFKTEPSSILMSYRRLRVLDASWAKIEVLPSTVGIMKHLRYLNLSGTESRALPNSLCSLWNLQTLNLDYCRSLVKLPKNMRHLKNLRYLLLESCISLSKMPSKIRELTSLRTLGMFIVDHSIGNQLEELQCLDLGGKLVIQNLERVNNPIDAKKANLVEKHNLCDLSLVWEMDNASKLRVDIDEKVLQALQPYAMPVL